MTPDPPARLSSCLQCAKRKVRCDRQLPCNHCSKRGKDQCGYPILTSDYRRQVADSKQVRIEQLERFIFENGGDPAQLELPLSQQAVPIDSSASGVDAGHGEKRKRHPEVSNPPQARLEVEPAVLRGIEREAGREARRGVQQDLQQEDQRGSEREREGQLDVQRELQRRAPGGLVDHNDRTTYIEASMWFGWDEAKKSTSNDRADEHASRTFPSQLPVPLGYSDTLLYNRPAEIRYSIETSVADTVWDCYCKNIHPHTKIFFDWDKRLLIKQLVRDPSSVDRAGRAFIHAVYFIVALSLTPSKRLDLYGQRLANVSDTNDQGQRILDQLQAATETALLEVRYASTSDLLVLQAFVLYILAMRNRATATDCFALMGIAVRMAQRLGVHRDGSHLGLSVMRAEERRRVWWQMQHMEIMVSQLLGCISVTLTAGWDAAVPANIEDGDIDASTKSLPPERQGLTSMSHCLWRYHVISSQREGKVMPGTSMQVSFNHLRPPHRDALVEHARKILADKYLQYCELVDPLHLQIQVGIQGMLLALKRSTLQPSFAGTKVSDIPRADRDELLRVCTKALDYYLITETNELLADWKWHNECYFQWTAFVYVLVEARHRATTDEAPAIWQLIDKVCRHHPKLTTATARSEIAAIGRILVLAWQAREQAPEPPSDDLPRPWCVEFYEKLTARSSDQNAPNAAEQTQQATQDLNFDFDMIDWSDWERGAFLWPEEVSMQAKEDATHTLQWYCQDPASRWLDHSGDQSLDLPLDQPPRSS